MIEPKQTISCAAPNKALFDLSGEAAYEARVQERKARQRDAMLADHVVPEQSQADEEVDYLDVVLTFLANLRRDLLRKIHDLDILIARLQKLKKAQRG